MDADLTEAYAETFDRVAAADDPVAPHASAAVFAREGFADVIDEAKPLLERHWVELARNRDVIPLDPDYDKYRALDAAGLFRVYTARMAGRLVGYAAYLVDRNLHYRSLTVATSDLFWLAPEHRGNGLGADLFAFVEASLRAEGVGSIYTTSKAAHPAAARVLESLGHTLIEVAHAKLLGRA